MTVDKITSVHLLDTCIICTSSVQHSACDVCVIFSSFNTKKYVIIWVYRLNQPLIFEFD